MKHSDYVKNLEFDVRLVEWNLKNHVISQNDLSQHLSQLPDNQGNSEFVKIEDLRFES